MREVYVYWAVKWTSRDGVPDAHTIRVTSEKFENPVRAAKSCYGIATNDMVLINLGGNKAKVRKAIVAGLEKRTDWIPINRAGF